MAKVGRYTAEDGRDINGKDWKVLAAEKVTGN